MAPTADSLAHEFASHLEEGRAFDGRQPNGADERPLPDDQASMPDGIPLQSYEQAQTRSQHLRSWPPNSVGQRWAGKTQGTSEAEVRIKTIQDFPHGYPQLACFLDSDASFMIYRRFGTVFSRLLLNKQDELRSMETTLLAMDRRDAISPDGRACLASRTKDHQRNAGTQATRTQLLSQMERKVLEYSHLLVHAQQLVAMNRPSSRDYKSVINFMDNTHPVAKTDSMFIHEREDLITFKTWSVSISI